MGSNRSPRNLILRGRVRRFNLGKCNLQGCNNFITSLGYKLPKICGNHSDKRQYGRLRQFINTPMIKDYSENKAQSVIQWQKQKPQHIKDHKRI